ncbi:hypothetical protein ACQPZX_38605 [Actinoplanes sp. CA-142083]|uniref:hypothetical protein n=1 Tax=Actinoplanes sp. CA-142083 TaxID=3239903 RepID=UPI003D8F2696
MTTTTAPAPNSLKPCRCSLFEVGEFDPEQDGASFTTECDRMTKNEFAQGHDAKFVSFIVKGQLDGYEIRTNDGGMTVTFPNAVAAAKSVSEALGIKAAKMLARADEKAKEKAEKSAAKEAAKTAKKIQAANAEQTANPRPAETEPAAEAPKPKTPRRRGAKTTA